MPHQRLQVGRQRGGRKGVDCLFPVKGKNFLVRAHCSQLNRGIGQAGFGPRLTRPALTAHPGLLPGTAQQIRGVNPVVAAAGGSRALSAGAETSGARSAAVAVAAAAAIAVTAVAAAAAFISGAGTRPAAGTSSGSPGSTGAIAGTFAGAGVPRSAACGRA